LVDLTPLNVPLRAGGRAARRRTLMSDMTMVEQQINVPLVWDPA
jgi:hypothetical protein